MHQQDNKENGEHDNRKTSESGPDLELWHGFSFVGKYMTKAAWDMSIIGQHTFAC